MSRERARLLEQLAEGDTAMENSGMDAIELLLSRSSHGRLGEPAPSDEALRDAFEAAVRAPDHGTMRPWRFQLVRGSARERLGEVFREALRAKSPEATEAELEKAARKPLRAPLVIVVSTPVRSHPKVPEVEQILSAGAAAQNILLALHAHGFAGMWRTGAPAYDPIVKRALGVAEGDAIVGFLYAGTPLGEAPPIRRPEAAQFVEEWEP